MTLHHGPTFIVQASMQVPSGLTWTIFHNDVTRLLCMLMLAGQGSSKVARGEERLPLIMGQSSVKHAPSRTSSLDLAEMLTRPSGLSCTSGPACW